MTAQKKRLSRRELARQRRLAAQRRRRAVTALIITGVVLILAGILIWPQLKPVGDIVVITPQPRPMADGNAMGDPNAPVTLIEFSDFQCPFCRRFAETTEPLLVEEYIATGKVRFVYRSFGNFIGQESLDAAEAAYCAGDQGKFWEYHDMLFANQTGENVGAFTTKRLEAFAETLGLDMKAFRDCLSTHKYRDRAMQDQQEGRQAGIRATPSFILIAPDGSQQIIEGAQPIEVFRQAIDQALAQQP